ncbi:EAL and HDOD domain-containing protein [Halomonas campaniensis]|uniref:EAL and HDOD domain-containing protein n=1 Tax=Halomonas campaniensis TaxID=213554 RepID=UPI003566B2E3
MTGEREAEAFSIALQPIHDAEDKHAADRLLYRHHGEPQDDPVAETARALATAIYELDDRKRLGKRDLVIDLPAEWLDRPDLLPAPASQVIIGLPRDLVLTPELEARLDEVRERGYRLLVHASTLRTQGRELLTRTDLLRLRHPDELDDDRLRALRLRGVRLLADDIRDRDHLERFRALDCHLFDGRYLAEPTFYTARHHGRHGNRAAHLRLVNELYRDDVDLLRLYELILQMPHLHVAILRRANSSFYAHGAHQADLKRSIQILGLNELRRLVMTLSLAGEMPSSKLKVRIALIRAFMCRNLAAPFRNIDPEDAFTTGLFSMMGPLLDESQDELLDELPLDAAMSEALTRHSGHLGAILALAEEHEQQVAEASDTLTPDRLQQCYLDAMDQTDLLMGHL